MSAKAGLDRREADAIVAEAARTYFDGCRSRIDAFVDRNFSVVGSARLHGRAVGWDLLKAPANVALSIPQIGLKLSAAAARRLGDDGVGFAAVEACFGRHLPSVSVPRWGWRGAGARCRVGARVAHTWSGS